MAVNQLSIQWILSINFLFICFTAKRKKQRLTKIKMSQCKVGSIWDYFDKPHDCDTNANVNVKVKCRLCSDLVSCSKKAT